MVSFDRSVFDCFIKVVVLAKVVCWPIDCIRKKPGEPLWQYRWTGRCHVDGVGGGVWYSVYGVLGMVRTLHGHRGMVRVHRGMGSGALRGPPVSTATC